MNSLLQGKSGVRASIIEFIVDLLNSDIIPNFTSDENAGSELIEVINGKGFVFVDGSIVSTETAFSSNFLTPLKLNKIEAETLKNGKFLLNGIAALLTAGANNLNITLDSISALSCEYFGANVDLFDSAVFEAQRQHRGQISSSANLKLLLDGSRRTNNPLVKLSASNPFSVIPQVNGSIQDVLLNISK